MIVFLGVRAHLYTTTALCDGTFGPGLPPIRAMAYEDVLTAESLPAATYIFTDIERLTAWERRLAADLYRALRGAGQSCLNDPARVLTRYPLLRALHRAGINPFRVWRLDDGPIGPAAAPPPPAMSRFRRRILGQAGKDRSPHPRFPVFLRNEADHGKPLSGLLHSAAELEASMAALAASGVPLSGLLCVEFCAVQLAPGAWAKFNTFRIGDVVSTDHAVIEDNWCVKEGTVSLATPDMFQWEHDHVAANDYAAAIKPVFDIANIEYGRADHTTIDGREIVYEINTNPFLAPLAKQLSPVRDDTIRLSRARYAAALWRLDTASGAAVTLALTDRAILHRNLTEAAGVAFRP